MHSFSIGEFLKLGLLPALTGTFMTAAYPTGPPAVHVYGTMRNFMRQNDLSAKVALDTLRRQHLYGLGVAEGLQGELLIWNGRVATTRVTPTGLVTDTLPQGRAALLVTSAVPRWKAQPVPATVRTASELEAFVERSARQRGIQNAPFAFRLAGAPAYVGWHVMQWPTAGGQHTHDNHHRYAYRGHYTQQPAELLGFFSRQHQAVFTHHTTWMHMHVRPTGRPFAAHVDSLGLSGASLMLYLPAAGPIPLPNRP
ncbi:acetolactate decarboxylase [Hymenobacter sp. BT664]|uniref:Acetolactate decarboxylase n=1 Tax=Hymenobacter montanus TaxID=2771359 RepID=A0A927BAW9_9BACT|nr:acetolactate decarboxylase [Hymenobacter montanus]MBD2766935.1 acetolactate decarboxylase [Hymenobacter montanus]